MPFVLLLGRANCRAVKSWHVHKCWVRPLVGVMKLACQRRGEAAHPSREPVRILEPGLNQYRCLDHLLCVGIIAQNYCHFIFNKNTFVCRIFAAKVSSFSLPPKEQLLPPSPCSWKSSMFFFNAQIQTIWFLWGSPIVCKQFHPPCPAEELGTPCSLALLMRLRVYHTSTKMLSAVRMFPELCPCGLHHWKLWQYNICVFWPPVHYFYNRKEEFELRSWESCCPLPVHLRAAEATEMLLQIHKI